MKRMMKSKHILLAVIVLIIASSFIACTNQSSASNPDIEVTIHILFTKDGENVEVDCFDLTLSFGDSENPMSVALSNSQEYVAEKINVFNHHAEVCQKCSASHSCFGVSRRGYFRTENGRERDNHCLFFDRTANYTECEKVKR